MKQILLFSAFIICLAGTLKAQDDRPNVIKLNLPALGLQNFSFQYERGLTDKVSAVLGVSVMPGRSLPTIVIDEADEDILVDNFRMSGFAITPEFRFYPGSNREAPRGFYLGGYVRYSNYAVTSLYPYEGETLDFRARWSGVGAGFSLGAQWYIGERVTIDWLILGVHAGASMPKMRLTGAEIERIQNTPGDREALIADIESFDLPFGRVEANYDDSRTVSAKIMGIPFLGLRSGLSVGIAF
ncbi:MAG: DUF3575 domain-containing protein [Cytophagaceae bacterium]